jgi:flagellar biosynthesis protein FlhG
MAQREPERTGSLDDVVPPARSQGHARSYAIASGKGGVGKTWFAISLAATLARASQRILLIDGDLGLANVDVQLGLTPRLDLGNLLDDRIALSDVVTRCEPGGFDVLAGRAGSGALSALPARSLEGLLLTLGATEDYDVILFDLGAGIDRHVRRMACWTDTLLVIATDEPTSLTDAYVVLKVHAADKQRLADTALTRAATDARIVVNQAATQLAGQQTYDTLARVCRSYLGISPPLAGVVRRDDRVRDAIRGQVAFPLRYPVSPAATDIERVAATLHRRDGGQG